MMIAFALGADHMSYNNFVSARQRELDGDIALALNEILIGPLGPFMKRYARNLLDGSISVVLVLRLGDHRFCARSIFPADSNADAVFTRCDKMTRAMSNIQHHTAEAMRRESAA